MLESGEEGLKWGAGHHERGEDCHMNQMRVLGILLPSEYSWIDLNNKREL